MHQAITKFYMSLVDTADACSWTVDVWNEKSRTQDTSDVICSWKYDVMYCTVDRNKEIALSLSDIFN